MNPNEPARRRVVARLAFIALVIAGAAPTGLIAQGTAPRPLALTRVTVIDPASDAVLTNATLIVEGTRIVAVGPRQTVAVPRNAQIIDGAGKYVIPGLWDMHSHMAQPIALGIELDANAEYFFPLFIAYGVTGVRDMGGDLTTLKKWRTEIDGGTRIGPRLIITGEKVGQGPVVPGAPFPIRSQRDIERSVKALWDSGAAFVKLGDIKPELAGILMREAWRYDLRVVGHVEAHHSVRDLALAGLRSVEHLDGLLLATNTNEATLRRDLMRNRRPTLWHRVLVKLGVRASMPNPEAALLAGYSERRADSLFTLFRATGTWQCPTLRLLGALYRYNDPNLRLASYSLLLRIPESRWNGFANAPFDSTNPLHNVYPQMNRLVGRMAQQHVGILAGTDTPGLFAVPGKSLHEELGLLVAAGLSPKAALRAATTGPADFLEARDSLGTIRVGAYADLVVLDGDPLRDIANTQRIRAVFARGRYFDRAALDRLIGEGAQMARRARTAAH